MKLPRPVNSDVGQAPCLRGPNIAVFVVIGYVAGPPNSRLQRPAVGAA
jgi:hypothetical protein